MDTPADTPVDALGDTLGDTPGGRATAQQAEAGGVRRAAGHARPGARLVSVVPSATEILFELGLGDRVVGVSHQCRYPPAARAKPVLTRSRIALARVGGGAAGDSAAIDAAYSQFKAKEGSPYALDERLLAELVPDVIFDQGICDVCAIGPADVAAAAGGLADPPTIITVSVSTLRDILDSISMIGEAAGASEAAKALVTTLEARIDAVRAAVADAPARPRVFCMEWLDPIWCAGHWVPDLVELAGGQHGVGQAGTASARCSWEQVVAWAPEVLVLMPCSFGVPQTLKELPALTQHPGWATLPAVREGRVWAVDSGAFSHHSHRTIDGLEMLAHVIHPDRVPNRWSDTVLLQLRLTERTAEPSRERGPRGSGGSA